MENIFYDPRDEDGAQGGARLHLELIAHVNFSHSSHLRGA